MRLNGYLAVLALLMLGAGCGKQGQTSNSPGTVAAPPMKPAPPTPIDTKREELGGSTWNPEWDKTVELALPQGLVSEQAPRDVRRFCPRFYQMAEDDKRAFWAYFFQALAGAEAGLKPETRVRHTQKAVAVKDDVTGQQVRSEGLLQLTYEDAKRYGCDFDWQRDRTLKPDDSSRTILQPKNNLECGVKILNNQVIVQKKPLLWRDGYWSTLRPGTASYRVFAKQMTNVPTACGVEHGRRANRSASGR